jgi:hypothetical protein
VASQRTGGAYPVPGLLQTEGEGNKRLHIAACAMSEDADIHTGGCQLLMAAACRR